jgi:uncharacterized membrane protein YfcA
LNIELDLLLLAVGAAAGILSGLFGVGGGVIIVPSLVFYYSKGTYAHPEFIIQAAIATSLLTIVFTSVSASYKHFRNKNIDFEAAMISGLASSVTVFFVSKIAVNLHGDVLKYIIISVLMFSALRMLMEKKESKTRNEINAPAKGLSRFYFLLAGMLTGLVAAFTGLGGAIFAVPVFRYMLKFSLKRSIGTTSFTVFITAIAAVISYYLNSPHDVKFSGLSLGIVDFQSAIPIVAASIPMAQVGVYFHNRINSYLLSKLFAVFILLVSIRMIFF